MVSKVFDKSTDMITAYSLVRSKFVVCCRISISAAVALAVTTYSRVRSTRVGRTLEYVVTAVAMDSRVQKLPRVRGGSYTAVVDPDGPKANCSLMRSTIGR